MGLFVRQWASCTSGAGSLGITQFFLIPSPRPEFIKSLVNLSLRGTFGHNLMCFLMRPGSQGMARDTVWPKTALEERELESVVAASCPGTNGAHSDQLCSVSNLSVLRMPSVCSQRCSESIFQGCILQASPQAPPKQPGPVCGLLQPFIAGLIAAVCWL